MRAAQLALARHHSMMQTLHKGCTRELPAKHAASPCAGARADACCWANTLSLQAHHPATLLRQPHTQRRQNSQRLQTADGWQPDAYFAAVCGHKFPPTSHANATLPSQAAKSGEPRRVRPRPGAARGALQLPKQTTAQAQAQAHSTVMSPGALHACIKTTRTTMAIIVIRRCWHHRTGRSYTTTPTAALQQ